MTTTIQNNQSAHNCGPSGDVHAGAADQAAADQQQQTTPSAGGTVADNNWQGAGTDDATSNNPFAGQVLAQQTNGPVTSTSTTNEYGGVTLQSTVDVDGNGENEASLTSVFDESGNVRSNAYTMDNSGDGVVDYG